MVVLAAGRGTRMKSSLPKVLHPLCGRTLLGHALAAAEAIEPLAIIPVIRHERDLVATEIERVCPTALIADQDDVPGTGRAVWCGLTALDALAQASAAAGGHDRDTVLASVTDGAVVVTSADVPLVDTELLAALLADHQAAGRAVTVMSR